MAQMGWTGALVALVCVPQVAFGQSEAGPVTVSVAPQAAVLRQTPQAGLYLAQAATIQVQSHAPYWRMTVVAEPAIGPGGARIGPESLSLVPVEGAPSMGMNFAAGPLPLATPSVLGEGTATAGAPLGRFVLQAKLDPSLPPGTYSGRLIFTVSEAGRGEGGGGASFGYNIVVEPFTRIYFQGGDWQFHAGAPGIIHPGEVVRLVVETNLPQTSLTVALDGLHQVGGAGIVAPGRIALGWGLDEGQARQAGAAAPMGQNRLNLTAGMGTTVFCLYGRIATDLSVPAGRYVGTLVVGSGGANGG
jgi:hypothetical protein